MNSLISELFDYVFATENDEEIQNRIILLNEIKSWIRYNPQDFVSEFTWQMNEWASNKNYCVLCGRKKELFVWNEFRPYGDSGTYETMSKMICPNCDSKND